MGATYIAKMLTKEIFLIRKRIRIIRGHNLLLVERVWALVIIHSLNFTRDEQTASHDRLIKDVRMCSSHSNIRSLLITELVGHKHTNNIPSHSGPKRTFCLKRPLTNPLHHNICRVRGSMDRQIYPWEKGGANQLLAEMFPPIRDRIRVMLRNTI